MSYGRMINEQHFKRVLKLRDTSSGTVIHLQSSKLPTEVMEDLFISPCLIVNPLLTDLVLTDEIFGPLLPVLTFRSDDLRTFRPPSSILFSHDESGGKVESHGDGKTSKILETVRKVDETPLCLYIFGDNETEIKWVMDNVRSGGVMINDTILYACENELPFGGIGSSGMGYQSGKHGFLEFSQKRSVCRHERISVPPWIFPSQWQWHLEPLDFRLPPFERSATQIIYWKFARPILARKYTVVRNVKLFVILFVLFKLLKPDIRGMLRQLRG